MIYKDTEVYGVIYMITNILNGKVYIGQTTNWKKRLYQYKKLHCKGQTKLYNAFNKYGVESFLFEVIDSATDRVQLDLLECLFIEKNNSIHNGYNLKFGGSHGKHLEETRKKMSIAQSGENNARFGIKLSDDDKKQQRDSHLGKKQSKDHIYKRVDKLNKPIVCLTTGETFDSIRSASLKYNILNNSISRCCGLKRYNKSAGKLPDGTKLVWRYL